MKSNASLFVFNENSHLQGVIHSNAKLEMLSRHLLHKWNLDELNKFRMEEDIQYDEYDLEDIIDTED